MVVYSGLCIPLSSRTHPSLLDYQNLYFFGNLVYKFKRIVGKPIFSDQFKKIVKRYIRVGYYLDIMQQSACLVLNPTRFLAMVSSLIA